MKIDFSINVVIYFATIVVGLFSAALLALSSKNKTANCLLALLILSISGWIIDAFFRVSGLYNQNAGLYFLPIYYSFAFGPLLYFYVQAITNSSFTFKRNHLLHFIPVFLQALFYWVVTFIPYHYKYYIWFHIHLPYTYRVEYDGTWVSLVIYLLLAFRIIRKYQAWLADNYSDTAKTKLNWLRTGLVLLILISFTWFIEAILRDFFGIFYKYDYSQNLLCLVIYGMGIIGYRQNGMTITYDITRDIKQEPVTTDAILISKIEKAMQENKLYLNPELSLTDLSKHLKIPAKILSANINAYYHKPFNTFVNTYRVEEVKRRLKTGDTEKFTLLGLAFESGFNSKTSFNRIFKDFTGLSPSEYIQK